MSALYLGLVGPVAAQVRTSDVIWGVSAGAVYIAPRLLGVSPSVPAPCAPCDRAAVPWFDRFAIQAPSRGAAWMSHGFALLAVGLPALDLLDEGEVGEAHAAALGLSVVWAAAGTEWIKNLVQRPRPLLYANQIDPARVHDPDSRRSFPSGHTAVAAAAAASYWWSRRALDGETATETWVPWSLMLGTGVMRITAGKHFPSDIVGGFTVGILSALIVREVR